MSLIAAAPPLVRTTPPEDPAPLGTLRADDAFWPAIDLAELRAALRLDGTVTAERLRHAATEALAHAMDELAAWAAVQRLDGHPTLADVPARRIDGRSVQVQRFMRAICGMTHASLLERYADYDSTGRARKSHDEPLRDAQAEQHRRDARWAIRDLLGLSRTTVELI
jgi:hypothetical protein